MFFSRPIVEKKLAMTARSADTLEGTETLRATGNIQCSAISSARDRTVLTPHAALDQPEKFSCVTQLTGLPLFVVA
jgi:hypothetical protein